MESLFAAAIGAAATVGGVIAGAWLNLRGQREARKTNQSTTLEERHADVLASVDAARDAIMNLQRSVQDSKGLSQRGNSDEVDQALSAIRQAIPDAEHLVSEVRKATSRARVAGPEDLDGPTKKLLEATARALHRATHGAQLRLTDDIDSAADDFLAAVRQQRVR